MDAPSNVRAFWQAYLISLPEAERPTASSYDWGPFGDTDEDAEICATLVKAGIKTATSALLWEYEAGNEKLPALGDLSIVTGRGDIPQCVIEITETVIKAFNQVDEQFAFDYGEWDRSLASWRKGNWAYFSNVCNALGLTPHESMPLICQRFRVVYPKMKPTSI
jgi:uncharacterized protein YhfF